MYVFKTSAFGGYNKKQVDERISTLENDILRLQSSENSLKEQLNAAGENLNSSIADAGKKYDEIISSQNEKLTSLREENLALCDSVHLLSEENSEFRRKIVQLESEAENKERGLREKFGDDYDSGLSNIGKVYMRAYKSGAAVTAEAEEMSQRFLNNIDAVSSDAKERVSSSLNRCESIRDEVTALCSYISKRVSQIENDTDELVEKFRVLSDSFDSTDELRTDVEAKINNHLADYKKAASEFINSASTTTEMAVRRCETDEPVARQTVAEDLPKPIDYTKKSVCCATKTTDITDNSGSEPEAEPAINPTIPSKKISQLNEGERKKLIREALIRYSKNKQ